MIDGFWTTVEVLAAAGVILVVKDYITPFFG